MTKTLWIRKQESGWFKAYDENGKFIAKNPSMETLETSLNYMFKYNWIGFCDTEVRI